jgi:hypothetical protein
LVEAVGIIFAMVELGRRFLERHPEQAAFVDAAEADGHAVLLAEAGIGALNAKVLTTSSGCSSTAKCPIARSREPRERKAEGANPTT